MYAREIIERAQEAYTRGDLAKALSLFEGLPDSPSSTFQRAFLHNEMGKSHLALLQLNKCLELEPGHVRASLLLSQMLYLSQDYEPALAAVEQSLRLHPEEPSLKAQLNKVLGKLQGMNRQKYVDCMFQRLLMNEETRQYMMEESFLTKLEMLIESPGLLQTLAKMDKRLILASEVMLSEDPLPEPVRPPPRQILKVWGDSLAKAGQPSVQQQQQDAKVIEAKGQASALVEADHMSKIAQPVQKQAELPQGKPPLYKSTEMAQVLRELQSPD